MHRSLRLSLALCLFVLASSAGAAVVDSVFGGRIACTPRNGVQFCEGGLGHRIETWDGVPLDVNVTIPPASVDGAFPLIIDLHGWGLGKTAAPATSQALDGYVVMSFTARGFHGSCGAPASRAPDATLGDPNACLDRGWTHLGDARYEAATPSTWPGSSPTRGSSFRTRSAPPAPLTAAAARWCWARSGTAS